MKWEEEKKKKEIEGMRGKQDGIRLCNFHPPWDPQNITAKSSLSVRDIVGSK